MTVPPFLLLDLDDTILDYDSTGDACWNLYFDKYSRKTGVDRLLFQKAVEESRRWFWSDMRRYRRGRLHQREARRAILHRAFRAMGLSRPELAEEFAESFTREREEWIRLFPGAVPALECMRKAGARLALVTNGQASQQRAKLARFDLERFFDLIWIEGERSAGKPEAVVFQTVLRELQARPDAAWMIGDDVRFDILPAQAEGLHTAWIHNGRETDRAVACDVRAASLWDVYDQWKNN